MEQNAHHVQQSLVTAIKTIAEAILHMGDAQQAFAHNTRVMLQQIRSVQATLMMHGSFDPRAPSFPLSDLARAVLEDLAARAPHGVSPLDLAHKLDAPRPQVAATLQALKTLGVVYQHGRGYYRLGPPISEEELLKQMGVRSTGEQDTPPEGSSSDNNQSPT